MVSRKFTGDTKIHNSDELVFSLTASHQIILKVHVEGEKAVDVPVTPETVCQDVLYLTQHPGDRTKHHLVQQWSGGEQVVGEEENLFNILRYWDQHEEEVKFILRPGLSDPPFHHQENTEKGLHVYDDGRRRHRNEMRDSGVPTQNGLPGGVDLTLTELQDMAARQQQQIEHQQQVLVAKEQRLKYLKQQEQRHQQIAAENDRLRKLREKVETQEMKLKKLRALRGEAEKYKNNNGGLNTELESVKALFSEKEKELVMAVAKVEELTKQLEDIQKEKNRVKNGDNQTEAVFELEKLRKELMIRNKLNQQQNKKLSVHQDMLNHRKDEISKMDNRIHELQQRLKNKRAQQAEQQKNAAIQQAGNKNSSRPSKSNVAAVEPYIQHVPNNDNNVNIKSGFDKQNPKYQSLPVHSIKYSLEKGMEDAKTQKMNEISQEPNNNVKKPDVQARVRTEPTKDKVDPPQSSGDSRSVQQRLQPPPPPVSQNKQQSKPPPPLPVRSGTTGLTYLTARPFGSTYSTSAIGRNQGNNVQQQSVPTINVGDEVRPGGSGQSSPASSDSSNKDSSSGGGYSQVPSNKHGDNAPIRNHGNHTVHNNNGKSVTTNNTTGTSSNKGAPGRHRQAPTKPQSAPPPPPIPTGANSQGNPPSVRPPPYDQTDSSQSTKHPKDNVETANQNGSDSSLNSDSSSTGSKQQTPIRYTSQNEILNTYLGKPGPDALKKYQQNVQKMFTNNKISNNNDLKKGENNTDNKDKLSPHPVPSALSPPNGDKSGVSPPGSPNYRDIASDKVSPNHNRHTPKNLRRRHSDSSDNEDIQKLLLKYVDRYNQNASNNQEKNGDSRVVDRYDTKATSFKDQVPETVPVDSLGNLMDDKKLRNNDISVVSAEIGNNSDGSTSSSRESVQLTPSEQPVPKKKSNLKTRNAPKSGNRVCFDPLALLLDASLEGELELVMRCARQVENVSEPNDEGITALHNAICAGHYEIVKFLVEFGCDVNSPDSDGWTPLHCAASCNNLPMVRFLVEHGACIFATTISDHETAAEKCEEDEDGFDGCSEYLYSVQEKLGSMNNGKVWAVFDYEAQEKDELSFTIGDDITVLKKGDDKEKEWWWSVLNKKEGYIPRNLLGLQPRVLQQESSVDS